MINKNRLQRNSLQPVFIFFCHQKGGNAMIKMIGVEDLDELLLRDDIKIVDLRPADAYRKYHMKKAVNYPYDEMERWEKELLAQRRLLLYCERGSESLMAARRLNRRTNEVFTLIGGVRAVYDLEKRNSIDSRGWNR